jgi:hypothetical protein
VVGVAVVGTRFLLLQESHIYGRNTPKNSYVSFSHNAHKDDNACLRTFLNSLCKSANHPLSELMLDTKSETMGSHPSSDLALLAVLVVVAVASTSIALLSFFFLRLVLAGLSSPRVADVVSFFLFVSVLDAACRDDGSAVVSENWLFLGKMMKGHNTYANTNEH